MNHANLHVDKGEFVFVVGSSGSGKSTLIKLLMKELDSTSGQMIVSGERLEKMKHRRVAKYRRKLGVVFQDFRLLKDRNVYENVAFAQRVIGRPTRVIRRRVPEVLQEVGLAEKYKSFPDELSGGEQQRVALARALVNRPDILLADEPTGNLDPKTSEEIMKLLEQINERGTTVLVVTHNKEIVNQMKKRVVTMHDGVIISDEKEGGYHEASTIWYTLKQGIKNIKRNWMFSIASILTMAACIFLVGVFYSLVTNVDNIAQKVEQEVPVTVFFDEGTTEEQMQEVGNLIQARPEVERVEFESAEQAWENFKDKYFQGSDAAEGFKDDNPLVNSSNYHVYLNQIEKQTELVNYIQGLEHVRDVEQSEQAANTLGSFNKLVSYASIVIIALLLIISIFLISNTISVGISVRKEEIGIMKYIGATDAFVRAPFLLEGMVLGVIGAAIPLVALYFLYNSVVEYILNKFSVLTGVVAFIPVWQIYQILLPIGLALGIGIGFIGSMMTTRKHLRV